MEKKILIIEDEEAIQKILYEPLTFAGYKVTVVSDGIEGINKFHEQDFHLVLLDIMLRKGWHKDFYQSFMLLPCFCSLLRI